MLLTLPTILAAIGTPFIPGWGELRPFAADLWIIVTILAVLLTPFFASRRSNTACALVALAVDAAATGTRRFVVAGGETSGAVVSALGVRQVLVEDELDAGVPWCTTEGSRPMRLLLKSGNFGSDRLLVEAAS